MKLQNKFLLPVVIGASLLFLANSADPPNAKTGAPFDGLCSDCHGGGSFQGNINLSGLPSTIDPNTTYNLTLTLTATSGSPVKGGFQIVAVNQSNINIGDLINTGTETGTSTTGGREYLDHRGAKSFSGNTVSWNFDWKSPNGPNGTTVTMYFAGNFANGNNSSSGDAIENSSFSATIMGGGTPLTASISSKTNVSCFGGSNGSITVTANGGSTPYTYLWSDGSTNNPATGLTAGAYTVTVTDNGGSTATASASISQPSQLQHTLSIVRHVSCPGGHDGMVSTSASGGTPPYTIAYSSGSSNNLGAGMYSVVVTDANKCTSMSDFEILQPLPYSVETNIIKNPACPSDSSGEISLLVTGATPPYKFKWSSGDTSAHIKTKAAGNYKVTITDKNNCGITENYTLSSIDTVPPILNVEATILYVHANGMDTLHPNQVVKSITDNCDKKPSLTLSKELFTCKDLGAQMIKITARDASGNSKSDSVLIQIKDTIPPAINAWPDTSFTYCNIVSPKFDVTDNCSVLSFIQTKGIPQGGIFPIGTTEMEYIARDSSGNERKVQFQVRIVQPLSVHVDSIYYELCNRDTVHVLLALKNANKARYLFSSEKDSLQIQADTFVQIVGVRPDSIYFTITDTTFCQISDTIIPNYPDSLIHLDSVIVSDYNATAGAKGSIMAFVRNADSIAIYNDKGLYINSTGLELEAGKYYLHVYSSSCEFIFGPYDVKLIIQNENAKLSFCSIKPNPAYNVLSIQKASGLPYMEFQAYNTQGFRIVNKRVLEEYELMDVSNWAPGLYFIILRVGSDVQSYKITKL